MPSRVLRGEILESRSLARVSPAAEFFFWRLILFCDDYGRCDGRPDVLARKVFPTRPVESPEIRGYLRELSTCDPDGSGPLLLYGDQAEQYIQLRSWEKYCSKQKRAKTSRYPDPENLPRRSPEIPGDPSRARAGIGESGNRGDEESGNRGIGEEEPPERRRSAGKRAAETRKANGKQTAADRFFEGYRARRGVEISLTSKQAIQLNSIERRLGLERYAAALSAFWNRPKQETRTWSPGAFLGTWQDCDAEAQIEARKEQRERDIAEDVELFKDLPI